MMAEISAFFASYQVSMTHNPMVILLMICIVADTVFGCLRAALYHCWNSSLGINGGIRKVGMAAAIVFLGLADLLFGINLAEHLPEAVCSVLAAVGVTTIGLTEFFAVVFVMYEASSILKNMLLCGIPAPAGLQDKLAKWVDDMTDESNVSIQNTLAAKDRVQVPKHK